MPDHFATLHQPRRPWLNADVLKDCFHRASAALHPDVPGSGDGQKFAEVNAAYNILRDPAGRLRHLLELEVPAGAGSGSGSAVPPDFADLFMRLAGFRQTCGAFQKKEAAATQGLARALLIEERQSLVQRAEALLRELDATHETSEAGLKALDAEWNASDAGCIEQLSALQQRFAYLSKWRAQLAESQFQLQQG
jgi:curved DNA-binding protein CbpA